MPSSSFTVVALMLIILVFLLQSSPLSAISMATWPVPLIYELNPSIKVNQTFELVGHLSGERFDVNFGAGPDAEFLVDDILLHVSCRHQQRIILTNSFISGDWGNEKTAPFPIEKFEKFVLHVRFYKYAYEVFIDDILLITDKHHGPLDAITHLNINGDITPEGVGFIGRELEMPYISEDHHLLFNDALYVSGTVPHGAKRMGVSIITDKDYYLLHFDVRFNKNVVVRNHKDHLGWGLEDRGRNEHLLPGKDFFLNVYHTTLGYEIYINGEHRYFFNHKFFQTPDSVRFMVDGDVSVGMVYYGQAGIFKKLVFRRLRDFPRSNSWNSH